MRQAGETQEPRIQVDEHLAGRWIVPRTLRWLILPLCFVVVTPCLADDGAVVFGSFLNERYAELRRAELLDRFDIATDVVPVAIGGVGYLRLMTTAMEEAEALSLIERMERRGIPAWYLRGGASTVNVRSTREPAFDTTATAEREIDAENAVSPAATSEAAPRPVQKKQVVPCDVAEVASLELTPRGEDAVGEPVSVQYFEDVDITVDGRIDEAIWQEVKGYDRMRVIDPDTLVQPKYRTISRFLYTSEGLYVAAFMEQPPDTLVSRLSSRDKFINRDSYGLTLDTSGEGLYGYWFKVTLGGSLMDGKVAPERMLSEQWDGAWRGESARLANGWSAEFFLPWSMMAMPAGSAERTMGFWVDRKVAHMDELYGWPALPLTAARFMSALQPVRFGELQTTQQLAVFPYTSVTHDEIADDQEYRVGADLFWRPSTNLQLTATLNPDFGAVESDDVVVNLTAFETFFPEKRLFFLEGNEVFITTPRSDVNRFQTTRRGGGARPTPLTFTPEPTTLVNTRRIGGPPKHVTVPDGVDVPAVELGKPSDLLGAIKVAGSAGGFRYGVLAAFEDDVELRGTITATDTPVKILEDGRDFGVVRALYESSGEGRRSIGYIGTIVTLPGSDAMTHGIDTHFLSSSGKLTWDTQFMYSDVDDTEGYGAFTDFVYTKRRGLLQRISFEYVDEKLDISDLGFIRQTDVMAAQYGIVRTTSQLDYFRSMRNSMFITAQANTDGFLNRAGIFTNQTLMLPNRSQIRFELNYFPELWDDVNSRGNGMYKNDSRFKTQLAFGSDSAKRFSWSGTIGAEQEEINGTWTYSADFGFTYTPNDRFTVDLDMRYKKRDGWLVHQTGPDFTTYAGDDFQPRLAVDYFLSARQHLRLTMQWAGIKAEAQEYWEVPASEGELIPRTLAPGADNEDFTLSRLTAQFRYRWEIGPLSDLFVVYTLGSNLEDMDLDDDFGNLFTAALHEPIIEFLVVKLRYRFGT